MATSLARRERHANCDLALALGPGAPTRCGEWTAQELMAHLWVREHRPFAAVGIAVPVLAPLTDAAMARATRRPYDVLVRAVRNPGLSPFALGPVDDVANTLEYLVHHEDLRRGQPEWGPRDLRAADLDQVWATITKLGRLLVRPAGVPVVVQRSDTGARATLRGGADPVVLSGPVVELTLFLHGRDAVRDLAFDGPQEAVDALRGADLGT